MLVFLPRRPLSPGARECLYTPCVAYRKRGSNFAAIALVLRREKEAPGLKAIKGAMDRPVEAQSI